MKKLISAALAIMMIFALAVGTAGAEKESITDIMKEYSIEMLKELIKGYNRADDGIKGDYLYSIHWYMELYDVLGKIDMADSGLSLAKHPLSGGKSPMLSSYKKTEAELMKVKDFMNEEWKLWVEGKTDDELFGMILITMANQTIETHNAKK